MRRGQKTNAEQVVRRQPRMSASSSTTSTSPPSGPTRSSTLLSRTQSTGLGSASAALSEAPRAVSATKLTHHDRYVPRTGGRLSIDSGGCSASHIAELDRFLGNRPFVIDT